jgi:alcohol oxidase
LHVSYGCSTYKIADEYIKTAKSYAGIDQAIDVNDFQTVNKTCRWPKWINPHTGRRSDAAHGFVHPITDSQDNLHLLLESKAVRILFEGTKAVGVEYVAK